MRIVEGKGQKNLVSNSVIATAPCAATARALLVYEASRPGAEIGFQKEKWVWLYFSPGKLGLSLGHLVINLSSPGPPAPGPCSRRPAGGHSWCPLQPRYPARLGAQSGLSAD